MLTTQPHPPGPNHYSPTPALRILPDVQAALDFHRPVVALESTIISHGMPFPQNLANAKALEQAVLANGAMPATVAVIDGIPHIGLSHHQLHLLSTHPKVRKLARRDLPTAFADAAHGATTVSATMFLSSLARIPVFATGGIGGVHRQVATTFDISADILALASIPQLVVCAGAKSILDIPKTLEALETASVPVLVLGHDQFPAFYTRDSGRPAPVRVDSELHVARTVHAAHTTSAASGILLAVPVPSRFEADAALVEQATSTALQEMHTASLRPNQVTPFLLKRIAQLTDGASLKTNMHLARNNASVAARIAVHLSRMQSNPIIVTNPLQTKVETKRSTTSTAAQQSRAPRVLVVGGTALDIHCDALRTLVMGSSNAGRVRQCAGGVGKNVAEAAMVFGNVPVGFVSCVGDDTAGRAVLSILRDVGLETKLVKQYTGKRTGACCVVHDADGDLTVAVADFEEMFDSSFSFFDDAKDDIAVALRSAKLVCVDANFPPQDMQRLVRMCHDNGIPVWFEPTTSVKCRRIVEAGVINCLSYMSPNESELRNMADALRLRSVTEKSDTSALDLSQDKATFKHSDTNDHSQGDDYHKGGDDDVLMMCAKTVLQAGNGLRILCTRGERGVTRFKLGEPGEIEVQKFDALSIGPRMLRNTTGAGDCFAGRCIAGLAEGESEDAAIRAGIAAARLCCMNEEIVPRPKVLSKM